ncbi:hypothetical protein P691DRAFT_800878 [Macrolepiota fuliginosa MF-IS2]|uniref:Uncharacterized protein n=1 Tax=Macrolepiota fuliginosa MF-IS2 TaxID=1400762 RepID=A0A9P6C1E8_9AGAR|nr:hypothetical protein P691DRAFT_800878 [Macrolepiota fuliginosa MF-IS2]
MDGTQTTPAAVIPQHAMYPLSALDVLFERTTFVTGWLVEGTIDSVALGAALTRLTEKWRMLAGRLVSQNVSEKIEWYLRIPLGPLPSHDEYPTFSLTTTISGQPLTDYVSIPFTSPSPSFPPIIFIHPSTPRRYSIWEGTSHPLTCWHLTYFPAGAENNRDYTCIGFSRSHGLFDGGGAAMVMRALVAEMNGTDWVVPPLPLAYPRTNVNPIKECVEREVRIQDAQLGGSGNDYSGMAILGIKGALKLAAWHVKEKWWGGAQRQIVLLPKDGLTALVEAARSEIKKCKGNAAGITTGDVLVAWLLKTIYSEGTSPDTTVNCGNLASFRHLIPSSDQSIELYPHNAFAPLPYPLFTVSDLQTIPLHELTHILHTTRSSYSLNHVGQGYKLVTQSVTTFLVSPNAHENLLVSNVSASRILESDWRAVGAKRTVCGYRYQVTPNELLLTNSIFIAGRLEDGSTVLDVTLNKLRAGLLMEEVRRLSGFRRMRVDIDA